MTGGPTWANPHLPEDFVAAAGRGAWRHPLRAAGAGGRADRRCRGGAVDPSADREEPGWRPAHCGACGRVVVGVDPPASAEGDRAGSSSCGSASDGIGYVLADLSVAGLSPEGWARKVARGGRGVGRAPGGRGEEQWRGDGRGGASRRRRRAAGHARPCRRRQGGAGRAGRGPVRERQGQVRRRASPSSRTSWPG